MGNPKRRRERDGLSVDRREFLARATFASAALALGSGCARMTEKDMSTARPAGSGSLPRRPYGRSNVQLSVVGFGGIVVMNAEPDHAHRVVAEAVERGVNYFDVAPTYGDAEFKLGPALEPFRKKVFLACKTTERGREGAAAELKRSLERLRTDYFDLYQLHGIKDVAKDVDAAFAKGGAMELLIEAKKSGQVHHLGFSAHSETAAFAALDRFDFDSVMFPISFPTWFQGNFGPALLGRAKRNRVSLIALKAMARQTWPKDDPTRKRYGKCWYQPLTDPHEVELGIRFALSHPVVALLPPGEEELFRLALGVASRFRPITEAEVAELRMLAATLHPIFHA